MCHHVNKKNGCFGQTTLYTTTLKRWFIHCIAWTSSCATSSRLHCWNVKCAAGTLKETPGDPGNPEIFWHIPKEEFETIIKKLVKRMEACFAATNRWYFVKENVKSTASESEDDLNVWICVFFYLFVPFFEMVRATVFTEPSVTRDQFGYVYTSELSREPSPIM